MNENLNNSTILSPESVSNIIKILTTPELSSMFNAWQLNIMKTSLVASVECETKNVVREQYKAGNIDLDIDREYPLSRDILK